MFDEILKLPGVQNASGALLWFLTIMAVLIASLPHIVTLVNQSKDAKKERRVEGEQASQAKTSAFESVSAAEERIRNSLLAELERLQRRFNELEQRYQTLESQYAELQRQYRELLDETGKQTQTLERIERNTENG